MEGRWLPVWLLTGWPNSIRYSSSQTLQTTDEMSALFISRNKIVPAVAENFYLVSGGLAFDWVFGSALEEGSCVAIRF